jgi:transposase
MRSSMTAMLAGKDLLLSADGVGTAEIMRRTAKSKSCVWGWQERFMKAGVAGLLRDKTRPSRVKPLGQEAIDRVVALTATPPPHEATHWTSAAMAKAVAISVSSVQRIWRAHGLAPHRVRQFKLSNDPKFAAKLKGVVGLYVDPPAHTHTASHLFEEGFRQARRYGSDLVTGTTHSLRPRRPAWTEPERL